MTQKRPPERYPEHAKLRAFHAQDAGQVLGEFLHEFLPGKGYEVLRKEHWTEYDKCDYHRCTNLPEFRDGQHGPFRIQHPPDDFTPVRCVDGWETWREHQYIPARLEKLMDEFAGLDHAVLEDEKRAMLDEIRAVSA